MKHISELRTSLSYFFDWNKARLDLIQAKSSRATPVAQLALALDSRGYHRYSMHDSIANAMEQGYRTACSQGELFVVTGSTYIMAEARETLLLFDER